jgi:hypothetical protein
MGPTLPQTTGEQHQTPPPHNVLSITDQYITDPKNHGSRKIYLFD